MAKRTILRFDFNGDVWPIIETWAKERDFREKTRTDNSRRYQQGYGMMVASKFLEAKQEGRQVELQGWVGINILNRISTLFIMPGEIDLGSGFRAVIPRGTARRDVDVLLQRLGQPPIDVKKK